MVVLLLSTTNSDLGHRIKPANCLFVFLHSMLHYGAPCDKGAFRVSKLVLAPQKKNGHANECPEPIGHILGHFYFASWYDGNRPPKKALSSPVGCSALEIVLFYIYVFRGTGKIRVNPVSARGEPHGLFLNSCLRPAPPTVRADPDACHAPL